MERELKSMPRRVVNTPFGYIGAEKASDGLSRVRNRTQTLPVVPELIGGQNTEKREM